MIQEDVFKGELELQPQRYGPKVSSEMFQAGVSKSPTIHCKLTFSLSSILTVHPFCSHTKQIVNAVLL